MFERWYRRLGARYPGIVVATALRLQHLVFVVTVGVLALYVPLSLIEFVDRHPNQVFVLDHLAKPKAKENQLEPWRTNIRRIAELPNVYCKLSGLATEADWAALADGLAAVAVYGALGVGTGLVMRPEPQERAWLGELGEQLDRLPGDWDDLLTDDDPLTTLVVEVAAALVEAGLALHDCDGHGSSGLAAGGVCLIPDPASGGILVSWRQHDRMSVQQVRGAYLDAAVQLTMNTAVADVLTQVGFPVQPFGATGCHLVSLTA